MERENRPQILIWALRSEFAAAVVCMVLPIGLDDTHFQFTAADFVQVINGAIGALDQTADAVLVEVSVHQSTNSTAGRVVNAGQTTGTDGNDARLCSVLRQSRSAKDREQCCKQGG